MKKPLSSIKHPLEKTWESFRDYLTERRLQPSTIRIYEIEVRKLFSLVTRPDEISKLRPYLANRAPTTALRILTIWKSFLKMAPENWKDILEKIPPPKLRQKQPSFLTDQESFRLEAICYKSPSLTRDRLFVSLALQLGLRLSEILQLKFKDAEGDWLRIIRKGGKEQRLPIPPSLKTLFQFWKVESHSEPDDWIFPGRKGSPMTPRAAQLLLKRLLHLAGMTEKKITPHSLRHTFATTLASRGASLAALKEILGHQKITTTERYLHVTPTHLQETLGLLGAREPKKPI